MTFRGPRIRDVEIYVLDAYAEYYIRAFELHFWVFEEEEEAEALYDKPRDVPKDIAIKLPPPHHRFG